MASAEPGMDRRRAAYEELVRRGAFEKNDRMREVGSELRRKLGIPDATGTPTMTRSRQTGERGDAVDALARGMTATPPTAKRSPRPGEPGGGPTEGFVGMLNRAGDWFENLEVLGVPIGRASTERAMRQAQQGPLQATADLYRGTQPISNAATAMTNEAARSLHRKGEGADRQAVAVFRAGKKALLDPNAKPEKPRAVSLALGVNEKTTPLLKWPAAIADFIVSIKTDPLNKLADPAFREAGGAVLGGAKALLTTARGPAAAGARRLAPVAQRMKTALGARIDRDFGPGRAAGMKQTMDKTVSFFGIGPNAQKAAEEYRLAWANAHGMDKMLTRAIGATKGMLLNNPATQAHNLVGNHLVSRLALDTARVNPNLLEKNLPGAIAETTAFLKSGKQSPAIRELSQHTDAFSTTLSSSITPTATAAAAPGRLTHALETGGKALTVFNQMQDATEKAYKLGLYKSLRHAGKPPEEAAKIVQRNLFDYGDRSVALQFVEKWGLLPFVTYSNKAAKLFVTDVATRPDMMRRYLAARERMFADPADRAAFDKLPAYQKGLFTIPAGNGEFVDLNAWNPFKGALDTVEAAREFVRTGKRTLAPSALEVVSKSIPANVAAMTVFNRRLRGDDPERLKPVADPGAPPEEQSRIKRRELGRSYLPGGRGTLAMREATEGKTGGDEWFREAQSPTEARLGAILGLKGAKAETLDDKRARMEKTTLDTRRKVAGPYAGKMRSFYNTSVAVNPFDDDVAGLPPHVAESRAKDAGRYVTRLTTSGRVVDAKGRLTEEGRSRLRNAVAYMVALQRRAAAKK